MSIKKRLLLSNLAMTVAPIIGLLFIDLILGMMVFFFWDGKVKEHQLPTFLMWRFGLLVLFMAVTNGLVTFYVARTIVRPLDELKRSAHAFGQGNWTVPVRSIGDDEIGQLAKAFEQMRRQLLHAQQLQQQYETNRKELIAGISHDLRTPVTSIKGYAQGIMDGVADSPDKVARYVAVIRQKAEELDKLIADLFLYSKLDMDQESFHFETVDLRLYLSVYLEEWQEVLQKADVTAALADDTQGSSRVVADPAQLRRVLDNIVQNSLKSLDREPKHIAIRLHEETDQLVIEVADNGRGIAKADLPFIFDRFYRTGSAERASATEGSGLGLAIAKRIVEAHGGRIWGVSEPGRGTSIFFSLRKAEG